MNTDERTTAVGVFSDRSRAEYAVEELLRSGFTEEQIGIVIPAEEEAAEEQTFAPSHTKVIKGAEAGAAAGLAVGGLVGVALASILLPGAGTVLAGGLLAMVLGGAAGAAGGSIIGALIGLDIPEEDARLYEHYFHLGHSLITVKAGARYEDAMAILRSAQEKPEPKQPHHGKGRLAKLAEGGRDAGSGSAFVPEP